MTFGVRQNTANGWRQSDGTYMVPEFIGKINITSAITEAYNGGENNFQVTRYGGPVPYKGGRGVMIFWTIPDTSNDVWYWPQDQYIYPNTGESFNAGMDMIKQLGTATPGTPEGYAFALDFCTKSDANYGRRIWNPDTGKLIFDSGHKLLNIQQVGTLGFSASGINSYGFSLPAKPAILIPRIYRDIEDFTGSLDTSNNGNSEFTEYLGAVRRRGNVIDTRMVLTDNMNAPASNFGRASYHQDQTYGNINGVFMPVINASLYD